MGGSSLPAINRHDRPSPLADRHSHSGESSLVASGLRSGVTVNAITPATIQTPILEQVTPEFIASMRSKIPMERFGTVEEAASLICWLASRECSFSTGAVFDLSGGRTTY